MVSMTNRTPPPLPPPPPPSSGDDASEDEDDDTEFHSDESDSNDGVELQLGVTLHEFMLISICQCLCHIMKVSSSHGFICLLVSKDLWFHRFRGVNGFINSCVSWFHRYGGV